MAEHGYHPEPNIIKDTLSAVVQIVALRKGMLGNYSAAWTGSGTIVDPRGYVLTNCHVANPRAMGMPGSAADALAIAMTTRSDEPPAITYIAEVVVMSPELDIAVLKITSEPNGKKVRGLKLPYLPVGDSDKLELGDNLAIFGYPGIGGETITFTSGSVSGFTKQNNVKVRRAWIKTDATIAGGNSGGTAINHDGELVGIPTQASAGTGISPVDARPVVDTNRDGRVDQQDTPMAIGGFINGLRPANLAKPLLREAGAKVSGAGTRTKVPMTKPSGRVAPRGASRGQSRNRSGAGSSAGAAKPKTQRKGATFSNLVFSSRVSRDGRPINPTQIMRAGSRQIFATFDFEGLRKGTAWSMVWTLNGEKVLEEKGKWEDGPKGRKGLAINSNTPLAQGEYHLILTIRRTVALEGTVIVGRKVNDTDSEISGTVVDAKTNKGINGALVIALKPGVRVMDFVRNQRPDMSQGSIKTNRDGSFTFKKQLPKGQAYGLVVIARAYKDLVVESGLRISAQAPERANMGVIPMQKG